MTPSDAALVCFAFVSAFAIASVPPAVSYASERADELAADFQYLVAVEEENAALRARIARLDEANARLDGGSLEARRFRSLLGLRTRLAGEVIAAEVIDGDVSPFFRITRVEVDRAHRGRVGEGMAVISGAGLVGDVRRSSGRYADVRLIVDAASRVEVVVQRTGATGVLRGTEGGDGSTCRFEALASAEDLQLGDLVHTSGVDRFPASILVGRITRIIRQDSGLWQEVEVTPAVDFSRLEALLVLTEGARRAAVEEGDDDESTAPAEER